MSLLEGKPTSDGSTPFRRHAQVGIAPSLGERFTLGLGVGAELLRLQPPAGELIQEGVLELDVGYLAQAEVSGAHLPRAPVDGGLRATEPLVSWALGGQLRWSPLAMTAHGGLSAQLNIGMLVQERWVLTLGGRGEVRWRDFSEVDQALLLIGVGVRRRGVLPQKAEAG